MLYDMNSEFYDFDLFIDENESEIRNLRTDCENLVSYEDKDRLNEEVAAMVSACVYSGTYSPSTVTWPMSLNFSSSSESDRFNEFVTCMMVTFTVWDMEEMGLLVRTKDDKLAINQDIENICQIA